MRNSSYWITVSILIALFLSGSIFGSTFAQSSPAEVGVFDSYEVAPGATVQVPVSIRGVDGLYGVDFTLTFDPDRVQVEDADAAMEGVQAALGNFLDPGLLLFNIADNQAGTLHFTMAQYNPSEAKSGSGILLVITFTGIAPGESPLTMSAVSLSNREGEEIPSRGVNSSLVINEGAPTQAATFPVVLQPTGLVVLKTFTPTPTYTPVPTATPQPTSTSALSATDTSGEALTQQGETSSSNATSTPFLVRNWWLVLLLLLVVILFGYFGYKKISHESKGNGS